jgi:sterol desaturase/sphingolipid hydroxylase (fatty acid hydroxylase superfamily)
MMTIFVLGELFVLKFYKRISIDWKDVVSNLNSGHLAMWILRGIEVLSFGLILKYASLHVVERWNIALQWAFAFVAWDFCFYWMHRLHHTLPIFWAVHAVHHQGERFNLSLGIRNSWYSSLTSLLFVAVLAVLGVQLEIFVAVSSIHYTVQFYNHTGLVGKSGILEKFMVTPSHHRVHHGVDPAYIDRNFGGTFLIWDKLFGTFQAELDSIEPKYGILGGSQINNPLQANLAPIFAFVNWRFPQFKETPSFEVPDFFIGAGGLILFGLVIYYVNQEGRLHGLEKVALFAFILAGTLALGGLSDARRWGAISWTLVAITLPLLYLFYFGARDTWGSACFSLLFLHGIDGLRRLLKVEPSATVRSGTRT